MKLKITSAVAALFLVGGSHAQTTASFKSNATLSSTCNISVTDAVFGSYDPLATDHLQTTQIVNVKCTKGTSYKLGMQGYDGSTGLTSYGWTSSMTSSVGNNKLAYQVGLSWMGPTSWNSAFTWSPGSGTGYYPYNGIGTGDFESMPISYRILKNQYVAPGNYSATPNMNVYF